MNEGEPTLPSDSDASAGLPTAKDTFFGDHLGPSDTWASEWEREHDWYYHLTGYKDAADAPPPKK